MRLLIGGKAMLGFDRITFNPAIMGGRACIRGMRVTVSLVINLVANDMSYAEIIDAYPYLETEDIRQALQYIELGQGAIISVTEGQIRLRALPL